MNKTEQAMKALAEAIAAGRADDIPDLTERMQWWVGEPEVRKQDPGKLG